MTAFKPPSSSALAAHPIFSLPKTSTGLFAQSASPLELSTKTLSHYTDDNDDHNSASTSGRARKNVLILKDSSDLILAAHTQLRICPIFSSPSSYKTLDTPNIDFAIHEIVLNPTGKLLAVAGKYKVAVVVLPQPGYARLVPSTIPGKSVIVGPRYHALRSSAVPLAKVVWHPLGEAGTTLCVLTTDGVLREYDVSVDPEEPGQVLSFAPPQTDRRKSGRFIDEDPAERQIASFTFGGSKGQGSGADWGPLTVYGVMQSGDVYSLCPYLPMNASLPAAYLYALESYVSAKLEFLSTNGPNNEEGEEEDWEIMYDYQRKYISTLVKQLPPSSAFPSSSSTQQYQQKVKVHPAKTIRAPVARQGPFLLQPAPLVLEGSEGGEATDIIYLDFTRPSHSNNDGEGAEGEGMKEHLGLVLIAYQDGKVDVCLDVEKVEAKWNTKGKKKRPNATALPMLAVYETIDLGIVSSLLPLSQDGPSSSNRGPKPLDMLQANNPLFHTAPDAEGGVIYVSHAFGVHAINLDPVLKRIEKALCVEEGDDSAMEAILKEQDGHASRVQPVLSTFSVERRCSNPIVGLAIPDVDVYADYSILILSSAMRLSTVKLDSRNDSDDQVDEVSSSLATKALISSTTSNGPPPPQDQPSSVAPPKYMSLLAHEPYKPPSVLTGQLPLTPKLSLPPSSPLSLSKEFVLTPDTLRFLSSTVSQLSLRIREVCSAQREAEARYGLQTQEMIRMCEKVKEIEARFARLRSSASLSSSAPPGTNPEEGRIEKIKKDQAALLERTERLLSAMMRRASPELSAGEREWFEELKRMQNEVGGMKAGGLGKSFAAGGGTGNTGTLSSRVRVLEDEYEMLMPDFEWMMERENRLQSSLRKSVNGASNGGSSNLAFLKRDFEKSHRSEKMKIERIQNEIRELGERLGVSLARKLPP